MERSTKITLLTCGIIFATFAYAASFNALAWVDFSICVDNNGTPFEFRVPTLAELGPLDSAGTIIREGYSSFIGTLIVGLVAYLPILIAVFFGHRKKAVWYLSFILLYVSLCLISGLILYGNSPSEMHSFDFKGVMGWDFAFVLLFPLNVIVILLFNLIYTSVKTFVRP